MQLCSWQIEQGAETMVTDHARGGTMAQARTPATVPGAPLTSQIRITGHLDRQWASWFEGLAIALEDNGETLRTGLLVDRAALHGVRPTVRGLGIPLLSVAWVKPVRQRQQRERMVRVLG
jgi:hypothetical protein